MSSSLSLGFKPSDFMRPNCLASTETNFRPQASRKAPSPPTPCESKTLRTPSTVALYFKDASLVFEFALDLLHPNRHIATSPSKTILTMGTPLPHSFLSNHKIYSTEKHTLSSRTKFFLSLFFLEDIHTNLDKTHQYHLMNVNNQTIGHNSDNGPSHAPL